MKTTTTNNRLRKAILLISLFTIGLGASAQMSANVKIDNAVYVFKELISGFSEADAAKVIVSYNYYEYLETAADMPLEIEEWMYTGEAWDIKEKAETKESTAIEISQEAEYVLEEWMKDEFILEEEAPSTDEIDISELIAPDKEPELKIEEWMTDPNYWGTNK
jgi:hypothetical protein